MKKILLFAVMMVLLMPLMAQKKTNIADPAKDSLNSELQAVKLKYEKAQQALTSGQLKMGILYYNLAQEKYAQGNYPGAIAFADSAIAYGQAGNGLEIKGMSCFRSSRFSEATNYLAQSGKISPDYDNNYYLGVAYYKLSPEANAEKIVTAMLSAQKFRSDTMSYYYLGRSYYQLGKYDQAAQAFEELLKYQQSYEILFSAGISYYQLERYPEAISMLERASYLNSDDPVLLKALTISHIEFGNYDAAAKTLKVLATKKK